MSGGILSGNEIHRRVLHEDIQIDPFKPENINPASIDLRLGDEVRVYDQWVNPDVKDQYPPDGRYFTPNVLSAFLDIKNKPSTHAFKMDSDKGWVLHPGILYLMHTLERVHTKNFVPVLDGKSSIGRLGIQVHITAGFGDPGYDGQYTLEVTAVNSIRIYPGMRFCQMRFHSLVGSKSSYQKSGHYTGGAARGAVASKAHAQFHEEP